MNQSSFPPNGSQSKFRQICLGLVCLVALSGCSQNPWYAKYGDDVAKCLENQVNSLRAIEDASSLQAASENLKAQAKRYQELIEAMNKDSWANKIELTDQDRTKIGVRAKHIEKLLDQYYREVDRLLEKFAFGKSDLNYSNGLGALSHIHENPFDPKRNFQYYQTIRDGRVQELKDKNSTAPESPPN